MSISAVIFVHDLDKMTLFYSELLRTPPADAAPNGQWSEVRVGGVRLWLHPVSPGQHALEGIPARSEPREEMPIKLVYSLPREQSFDVRVLELGGSVVQRPWGSDYCDPEGNVFSVQFETVD